MGSFLAFLSFTEVEDDDFGPVADETSPESKDSSCIPGVDDTDSDNVFLFLDKYSTVSKVGTSFVSSIAFRRSNMSL